MDFDGGLWSGLAIDKLDTNKRQKSRNHLLVLQAHKREVMKIRYLVKTKVT